MTARLVVAAVLMLTLVVGAATAGRGQEQRLRRLHRPPMPPSAPVPGPDTPAPGGGGTQAPQPPPPPPLPQSIAVDETEYAIALSRPLVGAGQVTLNIYNRGMDDHDVALVDADGALQVVSVPSRETRTLVARLGVGQTKVVCSLFAGTTASHEDLGMSAVISVG